MGGLGSNLAGPLLKKIIGSRKNADDGDTTKMTRDNILLHRRAVPKKVTLPNGRTFYARYERISDRQLPLNITVKRKRAIGPRRQRRQKGGEMISSLFNTGLKFGSKFLNSAIGQKIAEEGIKQVPNIYNPGVNRVSKQKLKRALKSDLANHAVKRAQDQIHYSWQNA